MSAHSMNMRKASRRRRGFVMVLALAMMALMVAMAVSFASLSGTNAQSASAIQDSDLALMAAESGLGHVILLLRGTEVSESTTDGLMTAAGGKLTSSLNSTANIGGATVSAALSAISVPTIALASDQSYTASIHPDASGGLWVSVTGHCRGVDRTVGMQLTAEAGGSGPSSSAPRPGVFDFGLASKSAITITGNARLIGANDPHEADVLSACETPGDVVSLMGNCAIAGDVSTCYDDTLVNTVGNISVGGATGSDVGEHIHIGVGAVEFPEVDTSPYEPYAVNVITSSTPTGGNRTFENIRIAAGTNPTFSGNTTIRGVVFIESPNRVRFTGNLDLTGVIVTEDAGENNFASNYIQFTGNMASQGVESLPDEPQFAALRDLPGSMLLAPGFEAKFTGNFGTVNGAMAADKFTFTGNAGGQIDGSIICYGTAGFRLTGNTALTINRGSYDAEPPGFSDSDGSGDGSGTGTAITLMPIPTSYARASQ